MSSLPESFMQLLKECNIFELIQAINDLKKCPEDINFLKAAQAEMKVRALAAAKETNHEAKGLKLGKKSI